MRCNMTTTIRQAYLDASDARAVAHIASCPACQAEMAALMRVERALNALPEVQAPPAVRAAMARLEAETHGRTLACAETLDLLEPYREGDLDASMTFLVEDHLLACRPCEIALTQAEMLAGLLRTLPVLAPPEAIAERIAAARAPWWRKLLPAPRVVWRTGWALAGLAMVMAVGQQAAPRLAALMQPAKPLPTYRVIDIPPTLPAPEKISTTTDAPKPKSVQAVGEQSDVRPPARRRTPPRRPPVAAPRPPVVIPDSVTPTVVARTPAPTPDCSAKAVIEDLEFANTMNDAANALSAPNFAMGSSTANPAV